MMVKLRIWSYFLSEVVFKDQGDFFQFRSSTFLRTSFTNQAQSLFTQNQARDPDRAPLNFFFSVALFSFCKAPQIYSRVLFSRLVTLFKIKHKVNPLSKSKNPFFTKKISNPFHQNQLLPLTPKTTPQLHSHTHPLLLITL